MDGWCVSSEIHTNSVDSGPGYPLELDSKILLWKTAHTLLTRLGEIQLTLTEKLSLLLSRCHKVFFAGYTGEKPSAVWPSCELYRLQQWLVWQELSIDKIVTGCDEGTQQISSCIYGFHQLWKLMHSTVCLAKNRWLGGHRPWRELITIILLKRHSIKLSSKYLLHIHSVASSFSKELLFRSGWLKAKTQDWLTFREYEAVGFSSLNGTDNHNPNP